MIRPMVHASMGLFILVLPYFSTIRSPWDFGPEKLGWILACTLASVAWLHNRFLLPVYAKGLFRPGEKSSRGGMLNYPLAVLVLFLLFPGELFRPSILWAMLALGDPAASVIGRAWGKAKLPWNRKKSWLGTLGYGVFAGLAGFLTCWLWSWAGQSMGGLHWNQENMAPFGDLMIYGNYGPVALGLLALAGALVESLDVGLDDNLHVPFTLALLFYPLTEAGVLLGKGQGPGPEIWLMFAKGAGVGVLFLGAAFAARSISLLGGVVGLMVCGALVAGFGWWGIAPLAMFFILGTTATKIGYAKKERRGIAQERGGQRGIPHVLANGGIALGCALLAILDPDKAWVYHLAAGASLATAAFDTCSSEVGKAYGRLTYILWPPKAVAPGTKGATSLEGTLGGFFGAGLVALTVVPFVQIPESASLYGLGSYDLFAVVVVAAFAGATFESLVGGKMESRNPIQEGHYLNTLNTLVGALLTAVYFWG